MIVGILMLAMMAGAAAALTALVSGQGVLIALALYSGCGVASVLAIAMITALWPSRADAPQARILKLAHRS